MPFSASSRFLVLLCIAAAAKITLAYLTFGTNDVSFFESYYQHASLRGGLSLYHNGVVFKTSAGVQHWEGFWHPPFVVYLISAIGFGAKTAGLSFGTLFRLCSAAADICSALLLRRCLRSSAGKASPAALDLFAASPVLVMMSGFHGNTDPLVVFLLILTVCLILEGKPAWAAGAALGLSISIKLWPVFLLPALALYVRSRDRRIVLGAAAGGVFFLSGLPLLIEDGPFILRHITNYQSLFGHWGFSRLIGFTGSPEAATLYQQVSRYVILLFSIAAAFWMNRERRADLLTQMSLIVSLFLFLTPGFGIQYLTWLLPWLVVLGAGAMAAFTVSAGFFMFLVYTFWSRGFPWNYADSLVTGTWRGALVWHELLCWAVVAYLLLLSCLRVRSQISVPVSKPQFIVKTASLESRRRKAVSGRLR